MAVSGMKMKGSAKLRVVFRNTSHQNEVLPSMYVLSQHDHVRIKNPNPQSTRASTRCTSRATTANNGSDATAAGRSDKPMSSELYSRISAEKTGIKKTAPKSATATTEPMPFPTAKL